MRTLAHLLALLLLLPQLVIFAAAALLDHVTSTHTFLGFLNTTLDTLDLLLGWGGLALLLVAGLLVAAGFSDRWRPIAASLLLAADIGTAVSILSWAGISDAALVLLPGAASAVLCALLIQEVLRRRRLVPRGCNS